MINNLALPQHKHLWRILLLLSGLLALGIPSVQADPTTKTVTQTFKYIQPDAAEVMLVWWTSSSNPIPEELVEKNNLEDVGKGTYRLPMEQQDKAFTATIEVPIGITIGYGFRITRTKDDIKISLWENGQEEYLGMPIAHFADEDEIIEIRSKLSLLPVTYEIEYLNDQAEQVYLGWGMNGWESVPETLQPPGAFWGESLLNLAMDMPTPGHFKTQIYAIPGSSIQIGFSVTLANGDVIWDSQDSYVIYAATSNSYVRINQSPAAQETVTAKAVATSPDKQSVEPVIVKQPLTIASFISGWIIALVTVLLVVVLVILYARRDESLPMPKTAPPLAPDTNMDDAFYEVIRQEKTATAGHKAKEGVLSPSE